MIELREILKRWGVAADVIGKTPQCLGRDGNQFAEHERGIEIEKWLSSYPRDVESFVILDDDSDMVHLTPRLVKTEFDDGLTEAHADQAIEMLAGEFGDVQFRK